MSPLFENMKNMNNKGNTNNTAQRRQSLMLYRTISVIRVISVLCLAIAGNVKRLWNELQTKALERGSTDDDVNILGSQGNLSDSICHLGIVTSDTSYDAVYVEFIDDPEGTVQVVLVLAPSLDADRMAFDIDQPSIDLFRVGNLGVRYTCFIACATSVNDA